MASNNADYYRQRASEERAKAEEADDPKVAAIHIELAIKFEALARVEAANPDAIPEDESGK